MERVRLFHWNSDEASPVTDVLRREGFEVEYQTKFEPAILRGMRQSPPDAVVIDLSRLPSHGREVATALRGNRQTRQIPILFVDGAPDKVSIVRQALPDATFCERRRLATALRKCIKARPKDPVVPTQMMDRYAGRTTAQKLGITAGAKVAVVDAPRDYARVIGALPDGVELLESSAPEPAYDSYDLVCRRTGRLPGRAAQDAADCHPIEAVGRMAEESGAPGLTVERKHDSRHGCRTGAGGL